MWVFTCPLGHLPNKQGRVFRFIHEAGSERPPRGGLGGLSHQAHPPVCLWMCCCCGGPADLSSHSWWVCSHQQHVVYGCKSTVCNSLFSPSQTAAVCGMQSGRECGHAWAVPVTFWQSGGMLRATENSSKTKWDIKASLDPVVLLLPNLAISSRCSTVPTGVLTQ